MPDSKITALTALTSADPANDMFPIVDVSDTSMAASGTTKRISINNLLAASGTATLASATISGDLTVDTSTLKVDSANNRVTVGTLGAYGRLTVGVGSGLQAGTTTNVASSLFDIDYASTGDINTRLSFVNSNGVTNAAIDRIGNPNFNDNGNLAFLTRVGAGSLTERYRIASDGVATWSNVGGVAGTAMTLNATGLGVGIVPSGGAKLAIRDSGANDSYIGLGANNDIYLSTGASGVHYFRKAAGAAAMTLDAVGNLLIGLTAAGTTAAKTIQIANGTAPTANVTGGQLYVEAGALKYRGSSGTVTTIANA